MPKERVVELLEFEMADPTMRGEMRITFLLFETEDGTEHDARHEDVPAGIVATDHEAGWRMSLARLKRLVERTRP